MVQFYRCATKESGEFTISCSLLNTPFYLFIIFLTTLHGFQYFLGGMPNLNRTSQKPGPRHRGCFIPNTNRSTNIHLIPYFAVLSWKPCSISLPLHAQTFLKSFVFMLMLSSYSPRSEEACRDSRRTVGFV